ncbi:MAG: TIGR00296 family protein [Candidatus Marsarchaeota archaeon]|jgi:uncharacterized protein (TIGR00296 family)|nr:TIGR00296 family protein [Candidatus Marsarchaeota archaeon]
MKIYDMNDGIALVRSARNAIELHQTMANFRNEVIERQISRFDDEMGVFVTIEHYPTRTLRGRMGFPTPHNTLKHMLVEAAISAATEDPRFVPVSHMEFDEMLIEINLLSKPELIESRKIADIKNSIKVGRDGLMIKYGYNSSLILPAVAIEKQWSAEEFLRNVCVDAGLPEHAWKNRSARLYRFRSQAFREFSPRGPVEEIIFE